MSPTNNYEDVIKLWENDLATIEGNEEIRIVSGEGLYDLYVALKQPLIDAVDKFGVVFKMIIGRIVSIDKRKGTSPILELADQGYLQLWVAPYRPLTHYRAFDLRLMYKEKIHRALASKRHGEYIRDPLVISKYAYDFENLIRSFPLKKYSDKDSLILLSKDEIRKLRGYYGNNYDFITPTQVQAVVGNVGI